MNEAVIREIALAVAKEQILLQWQFYSLLLALALVLGYGAAFIGGYARHRGVALATKADFDGLLTQLQATTAVAEEVKAKVSHSDWASRELKTLRRLKLEELLHAIHQTQSWQEAHRSFHFFQSKGDPGESPITKVSVLVGLYFPELQDKVATYVHLHGQTTVETMRSGLERSRAGDDLVKFEAARKGFIEKMNGLLPKQLHIIYDIELAARSIMAELTGMSAAASA